jgi:hypothetical protein
MEQFNPSNPEYKEVNDLPNEERENYVDVAKNAFVKKSVLEAEEDAQQKANEINKARTITEKFLFKNKVNEMDVLQDEAIKENKARESVTFAYQQDYREIFGEWPEVHYPLDSSVHPPMHYDIKLSQEIINQLNYFKTKYEEDKSDKKDKILYGIALLSYIVGVGNDLKQSRYALLFDNVNDKEYWDYYDLYVEKSREIASNKNRSS